MKRVVEKLKENNKYLVISDIHGSNYYANKISEICKKVYLIQNLDFLTAEDMLKERIKEKIT